MASFTVIFSAMLSMAVDTNAASLRASNNSVRSATQLQGRTILLLLVRRSKVQARDRCIFIVVDTKLLTVILR